MNPDTAMRILCGVVTWQVILFALTFTVAFVWKGRPCFGPNPNRNEAILSVARLVFMLNPPLWGFYIGGKLGHRYGVHFSYRPNNPDALFKYGRHSIFWGVVPVKGKYGAVECLVFDHVERGYDVEVEQCAHNTEHAGVVGDASHSSRPPFLTTPRRWLVPPDQAFATYWEAKACADRLNKEAK